MPHRPLPPSWCAASCDRWTKPKRLAEDLHARNRRAASAEFAAQGEPGSSTAERTRPRSETAGRRRRARDSTDPMAFVCSNLKPRRGKLETTRPKRRGRARDPRRMPRKGPREGCARRWGSCLRLARRKRVQDGSRRSRRKSVGFGACRWFARRGDASGARWTEFLTAVPAVRGGPRACSAQVGRSKLLLNGIARSRKARPADHRIAVSTGKRGADACGCACADKRPRRFRAPSCSNLFDPFSPLAAERRHLAASASPSPTRSSSATAAEIESLERSPRHRSDGMACPVARSA